MNSVNPAEKILSGSPSMPEKNKKAGDGFSERLKDSIKEVNRLQNVADESAEKVVTGKLGVHEGMIALQEADVSLRLLLQVRSKVMAAYQEIIRMPV